MVASSLPVTAVTEAGTIAGDVEAGEALVLLTQLRDEPFVPRRANGKKLDKSVMFRWASRGVRGQRLETLRTPSGLATTRSAVLRFFAGLSGVPADPPPRRSPAARQRDVRRAEAVLREVGL